MRHFVQFMILLFIFNISLLDAQTNISIRKKEFRKDKAGFEVAWEHVKSGDSYYVERGIWYGDAFNEYVQARTYNAVNPELNYKTGVAALYSDNKEKASEFFLRALQEKSNLTNDILLLTGRSLQYTGNYNEAVNKLQGYLNNRIKKSAKDIALARKYLGECDSAMKVIKDTLRVEIKDMGPNINSNADEYAEFLSADGKTMYFASRRQFIDTKTHYPDSKFDENIFYSTFNDGQWSVAASAGKNLNTKYSEAPLYINDAGDKLYIYAGYERGGDIKVSELKKGQWKPPGSIPYKINTSGAETSFTFSPSGNEIWYVTDKGKKGLGGKDIYIIRKLSNRKWSKPINAGPNINTVYDEESVRFSEKGDTVWFSSKGHNSMGGFDIFYSVKDMNGVWGKAVNCGYPINTQWDELFYYPAKGGSKTFYFASNRPGTMGGMDIFEGKFLPPKPVPEPVPVVAPVIPAKRDTVVIRDTVVVIRQAAPQAPAPEPPKETGLYLIGKVKDSESEVPILARIDIIDLETDQTVATTASSDADGSYRVKLPSKKAYMVDFRGNGYLSDMKRAIITSAYSSDVYTLDESLIKVKVGKKVVLNNILFETGKAVLTAGSYKELDHLLEILQDNPQMRIEISGHTDKTGSEPINFKLSEERAKAVVEYLVEKGIDRSRLEFRGYGSLQPISDNATAAGRTKNRRVEFKILEF
ncbi:MAG: OmpA family protein [Bacteroidales bacterium]|jgi:outer membrane protein OmpA-like peptidoglycan-associated protein